MMWRYFRNSFKYNTILAVFCLILLTEHAGRLSVIADSLTDEINLVDIQPPYAFYRVCKLVSGDLWTVGGYGQVRRISQDGASRIQRIPDTHFSAVFFIDSKTGWIAGTDGAIFFTTDGGENWTKQNSGSKVGLKGIVCANTTLCWAVGHYGTVLRTKDSGTTWEKLNTGLENDLYAVDFIDEQLGWAVGSDGIIIQTQDGGEQWVARSVTTRPLFNNPEYSPPDMYAVKMFDRKKGWVAGQEGVYQTEDGGVTWTRRIKNSHFFGLVINRPNRVWAVGNRGINYLTDDLGKVWQKYTAGSKNKAP